MVEAPADHEPGADAGAEADVDDVGEAAAGAEGRPRRARRGSRRCRPGRGGRAARRASRARDLPAQPGRITAEPTVPVRRSIGPGRPTPAPTSCATRRRPPRRGAPRSSRPPRRSRPPPSGRRRSRRSPRRGRSRRGRRARPGRGRGRSRCRRRRRRSGRAAGRRAGGPRPGWRSPSASSTTRPRAWRSATRLPTVVRERPVSAGEVAAAREPVAAERVEDENAVAFAKDASRPLAVELSQPILPRAEFRRVASENPLPPRGFVKRHTKFARSYFRPCAGSRREEEHAARPDPDGGLR